MTGEKPHRVQLKCTKGWCMPPNTVKVDHSTMWGNPWHIGESGISDAAAAVRRFRAAVVGFESNGSFCKPQAHPDSHIGKIINSAATLAGKNLACWCPLDQPCHADVLLELANEARQ